MPAFHQGILSGHDPSQLSLFATESAWLSMALKTERRSEAPCPQSTAVERTTGLATPLTSVWLAPVPSKVSTRSSPQAFIVQDVRISAPASEMLRIRNLRIPVTACCMTAGSDSTGTSTCICPSDEDPRDSMWNSPSSIIRLRPESRANAAMMTMGTATMTTVIHWFQPMKMPAARRTRAAAVNRRYGNLLRGGFISVSPSLQRHACTESARREPSVLPSRISSNAKGCHAVSSSHL